MESKILLPARKKLKELLRKFDGFKFIFLDNWRGYRFVYDVSDFSSLYKLLRSEKTGIFNAGLVLATPEDQKLFGPDKFLNCKSFSSYQSCFVNFLIRRCRTKKQLIEELLLLKQVRLMYCRNGSRKKLELDFKTGIIKEFIRRSGTDKKKIIQKIVSSHPDLFYV
ncbi:hypothetical protein A3A67_03050 [Candidatus Peribacteria bacterium RIFCSPLOWO2_01_FULL_51_18]|nr:MAG: hypothetical protein A3C52_00910 [Candidatus Peribacteria bacterium RIFCSPHIGHO2_02_FULL_51_15]OGJ66021.1 MAG: hypothetical protein A3A67_03050 [Candidatus Peribacteria bacterium RIFCSPLOWO2_01_FULL_51_18]OGJ67487.1 MAG: hypothetical protein A3J34_00795 [Candidatus Peribacteria bacterium RIFCSPLOWO2_02_FULL_51_10]